jgi:ABC-type dipeptide/oligopeptide/nickel transport system permease component
VVQTIVVILALWVVLAGIIGDLLSQAMDPRLRLGGEAA